MRSRPGCSLTQDVFLDGRPLARVSSLEGVRPGTYYADYGENTITLGSNPGNSLVEQAVSASLIRSSRDRVTITNLILEKAANEAQVAAVESRRSFRFPRAASDWRIMHNEVRLNHGVGIGIASRGEVRDNVVRDQGQLGIAVWGTAASIRRNDVFRNGRAGYDPDWEAGGIKAWRTTAAGFVRNRIHNNKGPALWSDGGCDRTLYRRNRITNNWGAGIQHEISYDARIVGNRILRNGQRHKGWGWEAGIQIQSSGGRRLIEVARNRVVDNANGIMVLQSGHRRREVPRPRGPHVVRNVRVHHNNVSMRSGQWTGLVHDVGSHAVFRRGIRFVANSYRVSARSGQFFAWRDELVTWRRWRGPFARQDRHGTLQRMR